MVFVQPTRQLISINGASNSKKLYFTFSFSAALKNPAPTLSQLSLLTVDNGTLYIHIKGSANKLVIFADRFKICNLTTQCFLGFATWPNFLADLTLLQIGNFKIFLHANIGL
jgi:hypothetical protein